MKYVFTYISTFDNIWQMFWIKSWKIYFYLYALYIDFVGTAWNPHITVTYCICNCDFKRNQKPNRKPKNHSSQNSSLEHEISNSNKYWWSVPVSEFFLNNRFTAEEWEKKSVYKRFLLMDKTTVPFLRTIDSCFIFSKLSGISEFW